MKPYFLPLQKCSGYPDNAQGKCYLLLYCRTVKKQAIASNKKLSYSNHMHTTYTLAALLLGRPPGVTSEGSGEDGASHVAEVVLTLGVLVACGKGTVGCFFVTAFGVAGAALGVVVLALGLLTARFRWPLAVDGVRALPFPFVGVASVDPSAVS